MGLGELGAFMSERFGNNKAHRGGTHPVTFTGPHLRILHAPPSSVKPSHSSNGEHLECLEQRAAYQTSVWSLRLLTPTPFLVPHHTLPISYSFTLCLGYPKPHQVCGQRIWERGTDPGSRDISKWKVTPP